MIFSCCWAKRCISVCRKDSDVFIRSMERVYSARSISPGATPDGRRRKTGQRLTPQSFKTPQQALCSGNPPPPPSSQEGLGAAPSGVHRSTLRWLLSFEEGGGSGEGVSAPPEPGLGGAVTPFLFTTLRKAVRPIFWRCLVKAAST